MYFLFELKVGIKKKFFLDLKTYYSVRIGMLHSYIGKRKIITFAFHFRFSLFHFKTFSGKVEKRFFHFFHFHFRF